MQETALLRFHKTLTEFGIEFVVAGSFESIRITIDRMEHAYCCERQGSNRKSLQNGDAGKPALL